ncbi:conserved Plasmodium protein, unknown function [Plasmodium ovale]|uniref:Uncharacterized protein n=1 Tax=Plasmodium ovale TaxID=36330 RepID=A0A1D3U924_PLAOA|nr:conserved Plasmodium protein, unknown function [Plasmodium ovale]
MSHKIDIFLYICKVEDEAKVKKNVIKKLIPKQKKFSKNMVVKYVLYNCKTKNSLVKKKWNINYILNKTRKKRKKREKTKNMNETMPHNFCDCKNERTNTSNVITSPEDVTNDISKGKGDGVNNSGSYKKLLNKIVKNVNMGKNTTIINTGVDTHKYEKNVFLYGYLFRKYVSEDSKWRDENTTKQGIPRREKKCAYEESEKRVPNNNFSQFCDVKWDRKNHQKNNPFEECLKKKKGLIFDIYNYIVSIHSQADVKISISSWAYRNCKIIDMIKMKQHKESKNRSKAVNNSPPFCHRCFVKKCFDHSCKCPKNCKNLPLKKVIENSEHLTKCLKRIVRKGIKIIKNVRGEIINVCFVFKYNVRINQKEVCIYVINFPLCNIKKNTIFHNNNNEKMLLFLFNEKIMNKISNVNDFSNFIFPFNNSKECQKGLNLKKKMISFVSHRKCLFEKRKTDGSNNVLTNDEPKDEFAYPSDDIPTNGNSICVNNYTKKKISSKGEHKFIKYKKKDIIFHIHLFELLIRLIFENSKTYFTFFINEKTYNMEFYRNIYYLNLSKIVNIRIELRNMKKRRKPEKIKNLHADNGALLRKLLKENDYCKNDVREKEKELSNLRNDVDAKEKEISTMRSEINEKDRAVLTMQKEILKYKSEQLEKMKIIEGLKSKMSKKEIIPNESTTNDQLMKNNNYIKKLYNENNLLREKIKKLSSSNRKEEFCANPNGKLSDTKEFSKISETDNQQEKDRNEKLCFFLKAFLETEQKLYTADVVINTQKEIIEKIKKEKSNYLEEVERSKAVFKKEVENSLDFIYSVCDDIKTKKEKICLKNRINKLQDCINTFLGKFEKSF